MLTKLRPLAAGLSLLAICAAPTLPAAQADSGSGSIVSTHFTPEQVADYSKDIERLLATKQARVAIVFRAGIERSDLPEGISYTHGSFWVYQPIQRADGTTMNGYVSHNLYHGDGETAPKSRSHLEEDFPFDFVSGSKVDDVAIIIPTPEMQRRILTMMTDGRYAQMHVPNYSLIANPFSDGYQNCTEFILDTVAAAVWDTTDMAQIKANLRANFRATKVKTGLLARTFGPLVDDRLQTKDHARGHIETATYQTLADFMLKNGLADETLVVTPDSLKAKQFASL